MRALPFYCCLAFFLYAAPALAQKPPKAPLTLLGRWKTRQISFSLTGATPDSVRDQLDNPDVADLNQAIFFGDALLVVEFKADSTYDFNIMRGGETVRHETGNFSVRQGQLFASAPTSPDGSSFHDQRIRKLARRSLVLSFPTGPQQPGVNEEIEYVRLGPYPAINAGPK
jgi:hypothetical protein